jgi:hypothetical protein
MNRSFPAVLMIILFIVPTFSAFSDPVSEFNATMTQDGVFYMRGPSFVAPDYGIYEMGGAGSEVIVLSRTSFTDRMAGVPEDYWYLVMYRHCGAEITGYIHGSALRMNPASSVLVFDPPGAVPTPAVPRFVRLTAGASLDKECKKAIGAITVPSGKRAVRFRLNYFNGDYARCSEGSVWPTCGFSIAPASDPGNPPFSYKVPEDAGPDAFDEIRDEFFALSLGPGTYLVDIEGAPWIRLMITYDLMVAR